MFTRSWGLCFYSNSFVTAFNSLINLKLIGLGMKRKFWIKLQSPTKWVETLHPKGAFDIFLTSKGENIAFPPPSPPCNVVPLCKLPLENNKHPNFEWRGQGRGVDSYVLRSYSIWVQCLNNFSAIVDWRQSIKTVIITGQAEGLFKKLSDVLHCFEIGQIPEKKKKKIIVHQNTTSL